VVLVVALLDDGGAGVTKVLPSDLLDELVLGHKVLLEAKRLVQRPLRLSGPVRTIATTARTQGSFLRYGPLLGLPAPPSLLASMVLMCLAGEGGRKGRLKNLLCMDLTRDGWARRPRASSAPAWSIQICDTSVWPTAAAASRVGHWLGVGRTAP
jgi:hypothetical protein